MNTLALTTVTIEAHCEESHKIGVSIRTGMHQLDDCFVLLDGETATRQLYEGQALWVKQERK